jgi:branched-chain amino acid transport system ATP-binding protein
MSLLVLQDLTKSFGGLTAVNGVSFAVEEGAIVGLIGPNGAGKTTVFNLITGNYRPERGRITFADTMLNGLRTHRIIILGIARTFQNIRLFQNLTALENVLAGFITGCVPGWSPPCCAGRPNAARRRPLSPQRRGNWTLSV